MWVILHSGCGRVKRHCASSSRNATKPNVRNGPSCGTLATRPNDASISPLNWLHATKKSSSSRTSYYRSVHFIRKHLFFYVIVIVIVEFLSARGVPFFFFNFLIFFLIFFYYFLNFFKYLFIFLFHFFIILYKWSK